MNVWGPGATPTADVWPYSRQLTDKYMIFIYFYYCLF
jgi:hypothetical protein